MTVATSLEYFLRSLAVSAVVALVGTLWTIETELHATDTQVTKIADHVDALNDSIQRYNLPQMQTDVIALKSNTEWLQRQIDIANGARREVH